MQDSAGGGRTEAADGVSGGSAGPLLALGLIAALIVHACVPAHPGAGEAAAPAYFDASAAARAAEARSLQALEALTPQATQAQVLRALNPLMIEFAPDSSSLPEQAQPLLGRIAAVLMGRPPFERYALVGHTDGTASPLYDLELSRRRAQTVADFLIMQGVGPHRLQVRGAGDDEPLGAGNRDEDRFRDRRLEFVRVG